MKTALLALLFVNGAQAHESLMPHSHPHGVSMLPGLETSLVALLALAAVTLALWTVRRAR